MKIGNKTLGEKPGFKKGNRFGIVNRGKKRTPEQREKLSRERKGKHFSPRTEFKKGQPAFNKGKPNPAAKNLPQAFKKGQTAWNRGVYKEDARCPLYSRVRSCIEYRQWRSDIFQRDNYTCVLCLRPKGGHLNADHIKPFSVIIKENRIRTVDEALLCEELWNLNNGRTLCKECHLKTDTYGIKARNYAK